MTTLFRFTDVSLGPGSGLFREWGLVSAKQLLKTAGGHAFAAMQHIVGPSMTPGSFHLMIVFCSGDALRWTGEWSLMEVAGVPTSPLVRRNIPVEIETVAAAERDMALLGLDEQFLESAAIGLASLPVSQNDVVDPPVRIREHQGHDIAFIVGRSDACVVVTVMRVWPTPRRDDMRKVLKSVDMLAMLRGATGI